MSDDKTQQLCKAPRAIPRMQRNDHSMVLAGIALLSIGGLGCGGDTRTSGSVITYDSLGVSVTENPLAAVATAPDWFVSDDPSWVAGDVEGDSTQTLYRVEDAATLSEGRVAILTREGIRLYDRDAGFLRQLGRQGPGPGEFVGARDLVVVGDSLVVFDWPQQRLTVFRTDGELISVLTIEKPLTGPRLLSVFEDGSFLMKEDDLLQGRPEQFQLLHRRYLHFSATGGLLDTLATHAYAEMGWVPVPGVLGGVNSIRTFGATASSAGGPSGFWATTGEPKLTYYDQTGTVRRIARWSPGDRTVTRQDVDEHTERLLSQYPPGSAQREFLQVRLENTPVSWTFPANRGLVRSGDGRIWVREYQPWSSRDPARWMVFDSTGAISGWVALPPGSTLYDAGEDYVLLEVEDETGVETVQRYQIDQRQ